MNKKGMIKISTYVFGFILLFAVIPISFVILSDSVESLSTTSIVLQEKGIEGFEIIEIKIESGATEVKLEPGEKLEVGGKLLDFDQINTFEIKDTQNIKHFLNLSDLSQAGFTNPVTFTTTIEIDFNEIRWNGTKYILTTTPLILGNTTIYDLQGNPVEEIAPNIFFDDKNDKRINYKDIAKNGGYAVAHEGNGANSGRYFIDLIIDNIPLTSLSDFFIDPVYTNQTDGFEVGSKGVSDGVGLSVYETATSTKIYIIDTFGNTGSNIHSFFPNGTNVSNTALGWAGGCGPLNDASGISFNGTDFLTTDVSQDCIVRLDANGVSISNISTSTLGLQEGPLGIDFDPTNNTEFWLLISGDPPAQHHNVTKLYFGTGGSNYLNVTGKFFNSTAVTGNQGSQLTTNGTDIWMVSPSFDYVYHVLEDGTNVTDGFNTAVDGADNPGGIGVSKDGLDIWIVDRTDDYVYHYAPDTTNPLIAFNDTNTLADYSNVSQNFIYANVSITETNFENISYNLYNSTFDVTKLVLYLPLDRNSTTQRDYSGQGNDGTVVNGAEFNSTGRLNGAYDFDGVNDHLSVSDDDSLSPHVNGNMTISWWFNVNTSTVANWHFGKGSTSNWEYGVATVNDKIQFTLWDNLGANHCVATSSNTFVPDTWNYGAINYVDGTSCSVTLNTVETTSTTITGTTSNGNQPLIIGSRRASGDVFVNGTLDEIAMWNRSLSTTEISEGRDRRAVNRTVYSTEIIEINWTSLADNDYHYSVDMIDTSNNFNTTAIRNILLDTTNPLIAYASPTEANSTNISQNWIIVNTSYTEINPQSIVFKLYNLTGEVNRTTYLTTTNSSNIRINFTDLADSTYQYNITVNDTLGNSNTTILRYITLDNVPPVITVVQPSAQSINALPVPFRVTTNERATCYYSLDGADNITLITTDNRTFQNTVNPPNGDRSLVYYCKDILDQLSVSSTVTFTMAVFGSSSAGSSSFTSTTIKDPKTVILEYPGFWERGENIEIVVNSYTSLNRLIIPTEVNVIKLPDGIKLIGTKEGENIKNVIKTFEVTKETKLGKATIELEIIEERNVTETASFTIIDDIEDKKDLVSELTTKWILYVIGGLLLLAFIIMITQLISSRKKGSK